MYNLTTMKMMMGYFLLDANIDKIDLCMIGIKMQIHYYLICCIGQEYFTTSRNILCTKKSAVSRLIILSKSVMT